MLASSARTSRYVDQSPWCSIPLPIKAILQLISDVLTMMFAAVVTEDVYSDP